MQNRIENLALAQTRRYIAEQLRAAGLTPVEQAFTGDTPVGPIPMVNVIATIPGRRADRIVIATHYDTKLFRQFRFVGASDAASSTAVALELARVLLKYDFLLCHEIRASHIVPAMQGWINAFLNFATVSNRTFAPSAKARRVLVPPISPTR